MEVIDGLTGEVRQAQIFVAVLGASNYTYAEASCTQSLPDWIGSHVRTFAFLGGAPRQTVSDNLKAGITKACSLRAEVNRTYAGLARHYGTAIVPARPYKPRDKAKVEVGVQVVERWILARLRNRRFFSLAALNAAIRALLHRPERAALARLGPQPARAVRAARPARRSCRCRPSPTSMPSGSAAASASTTTSRSHRHFYSVPHSLVRQEVEARITGDQRRSLPPRQARGLRMCAPIARIGHTTVAEHMPSSHRRYRDWTHERIRREAGKVGADAATLIDVILRSRPHPEQGFRSASAFSAWSSAMGPSGSMRPARRRWRSAPGPTPRLPPS